MAVLHPRRTIDYRTSRIQLAGQHRILTGQRSWNTSCPAVDRTAVGKKRRARGKRRQRGFGAQLRRSAQQVGFAAALAIETVQFEGFLGLLRGLAIRLTGGPVGQ